MDNLLIYLSERLMNLFWRYMFTYKF